MTQAAEWSPRGRAGTVRCGLVAESRLPCGPRAGTREGCLPGWAPGTCESALAVEPLLVQQLRMESPPGQAYDDPWSFSRLCLSCTGRAGERKGGGGKLHPSTRHCAGLAVSLGRDGSSGVRWAFPTVIPLLRRSGNRWGFCQLLRVPIPAKRSGTGEVTGWLGRTGPHCARDLS